MKISVSDINIKFSYFFILYLFWGYIIYNFLILFGMPSILGGYFGLLTVIGSLGYSLFFTKNMKKVISASYFFSFISLSCFIWALFITLLYINQPERTGAIFQSLTLLVSWYALFFSGFFLPLINFQKFLSISKILLILFLGYTIFYIQTTNLFMLPFTQGGDIEDENLANYQGIARNLLVIGLILIAYTESRIKNLIWSIILAFLLFMIGARSEFYVFVLLIIAYHSIIAIKIKSSFIIIITIILFSLGAFINYYQEISESRQLNILDISHDASWSMRQEMKQFAILQIKESPIFGNFGGHTEFYGPAGNSVGAYAHNALSAYVNYGLVFFILFIAMCYLTFIFSMIQLVKHPKDKEWVLSFLLTFMVAFLVTFSKPVFWQIIYFSWGVFLGVLYKKKYIK
jgi:hypothetical protein